MASHLPPPPEEVSEEDRAIDQAIVSVITAANHGAVSRQDLLYRVNTAVGGAEHGKILQRCGYLRSKGNKIQIVSGMYTLR